MSSKITTVILALSCLTLSSCATLKAPKFEPHPDSQAAFNYVKGLEGQWVVDGGKEGTFGWNFDVTSDGTIVIERLKVGTPTEMITVYHLENGRLFADHYCRLGNQPHLSAVNMEVEGDLHFICDGDVGSTESHAELHMHGVHFQKKDDGVLVWMDMFQNDTVTFQTSYMLVRKNP
ncbi:MAG: hypothetical protein IID42_02950 [Planctomycetes bacterium]|nr:hypothetical protein [Planctomycetota bacterium]